MRDVDHRGTENMYVIVSPWSFTRMTKLISWLKLTKYNRWLMKDFLISYYATLPKWGLFMIW